MPGVRKILELRDDARRRHLRARRRRYVHTRRRGIPFIPPVVERSHEPDGRTVLADQRRHPPRLRRPRRRLPINVVTVDGASHPYYALAPPGSVVVELEELPDSFQKKAYRVPENYKALFRDFNAVFPGVQQERKTLEPRAPRALTRKRTVVSGSRRARRSARAGGRRCRRCSACRRCARRSRSPAARAAAFSIRLIAHSSAPASSGSSSKDDDVAVRARSGSARPCPRRGSRCAVTYQCSPRYSIGCAW